MTREVEARKALSRRGTTVFKDSPLDAVPENEVVVKESLPEVSEGIQLPELPSLNDQNIPVLEPSLSGRVWS